MNPGEREGRHALRVKTREQLPETNSTVVDQRPQRENLSAVDVKNVGLDSLVGRDSESRDVVLPCPEGLHRALPTGLRQILCEQTVGVEVVDRDRNHQRSV